MKKLLNISVIAALAIVSLAANATPVAGDPANIATNPPSGQTAENVTASAGPKYQLAEANNAVDGVVATAGYVKGAYNAAIKAINKVSETASGDVTTLAGRVTTAEGKISDLETAVGDNSGGLVKQVADLEGVVGDSEDGLVKDVADLQEDVADLVTASGTYATQTGAAATAAAAVNGATIDFSQIGATTATITGTVPVVDTWGAAQPAANGVSVDLTNATTVVTGLTGNTSGVTGKISAGAVSYTSGS